MIEYRNVRVALLGAGSVGSQVARLLLEHGPELASRAGAGLELVGIAASLGLCYITADTIVEPPTFERIHAPVMQIIGTGKRIGNCPAAGAAKA